MAVCNCSMFCCTFFYVHSSIAIILMGKRELVALLNLSTWCFVMVERLFLAVPRGCLRFVIVVFPDHTNYFIVLLKRYHRMEISTLYQLLFYTFSYLYQLFFYSFHYFYLNRAWLCDNCKVQQLFLKYYKLAKTCSYTAPLQCGFCHLFWC